LFCIPPSPFVKSIVCFIPVVTGAGKLGPALLSVPTAWPGDPRSLETTEAEGECDLRGVDGSGDGGEKEGSDGSCGSPGLVDGEGCGVAAGLGEGVVPITRPDRSITPSPSPRSASSVDIHL